MWDFWWTKWHYIQNNVLNNNVTYILMASLEIREYGRRDPSRWPRGTLHQQKLALNSPTSGVRSVGMVCLQAQAAEFFYILIKKQRNFSKVKLWGWGRMAHPNWMSLRLGLLWLIPNLALVIRCLLRLFFFISHILYGVFAYPVRFYSVPPRVSVPQVENHWSGQPT
jgi:hypothetical protein